MRTKDLTPTLIDGRYRLREVLGAGSYGKVYRATDLTHSKEVVAKIEHAGQISLTLRHEFSVLQHLAGVEGIPKPLWFGKEAAQNVLILNRLGPTLEEAFNACNRVFTLNTIAHIAEQLVDRLQDVHSVDYIHRDLKPSNILIGREPNAHHIYLIDFSHATEYRHPKTRLHHSFRNNQCFIGTPMFAPINSHLGFEQGRRDDLESLAYIMIYFFHGRLPW
ncbi:kinase-like domain-containing protein, partial [Melanogaster broomeanus]